MRYYEPCSNVHFCLVVSTCFNHFYLERPPQKATVISEAPGRLPRVAPLRRGCGRRRRHELRGAGGDAAGARAVVGVLAPAAAGRFGRCLFVVYLMSS